MNPYAIPPLASALLGYALGLFVYLKNKKSKTNIFFLYLCFCISTWYLGLGMSLTTNKYWWIFIKIGLTGAIFIPIAYFHLCIYYFKFKKLSATFIFRIYYIFAFVSVISLYSNKYFLGDGIYQYQWGNCPKHGIVETLNFIATVSMILYIFRLLLNRYLNFRKNPVNSVENNRLKYFLLSYVVFAPAAIDYLPKYGINIYPFGFVFFNIFAFIISYAIIKHRLLDINIVIRKGVIYSILATAITLVYFIIAYLAENLFREFVGYKSMPLTLTAIIFFILLFQPLKNKIQLFVDKYFFKGTHEMLAIENEQLMEEIKRTDRLKAVATLAAGMAHEIKNPLTGIKTFTEYLDKKHNDENFRNKFKRIVGSEVDKINTIVGQLLDFAKPKPLSLQEVNIHKLLDETLSLLSNDLIKKRIDIVKEYDVKQSSVINADRNRLKQAFLNLFLNAMDAMKSGEKLTISTKQLSETGSLEITIQDTGKGIPKKELSHIFDPFYSTKEGGTGLGLSIVHGIIKEHGGNITCESEEGKGAKFIIMLAG